MTDTLQELTEEEFDNRYKLVRNHLNPHAGWVYGYDRGCLFETYGEELEFVRKQDPRTIWTLVDGDDGDQYLVSGYHHVNRLGYLLTTDPLPDDVTIQVHLPMAKDEDDFEDRITPGSEKPSALLVAKGAHLIPNRMYLRLYHGRNDPDQQMEDWGFVGPTFGPLSCYVHTYCSTFRIYGEAGSSELWLEIHDDMIRWDRCFYGDMEVFIARDGDQA